MNEREFKQNHSSDLFTFTRVTSTRKQARKTVGLTINPRLLEEARNRNLNLSRIFEQALASILEYIPSENQPQTLEAQTLASYPLNRTDPEGFEPPFSGSEGRRLDPDWATGPNHNYARFRLKRFCELLELNIYTID